MKRFIAVPLVLVILACQDSTPLQPDLQTAPELATLQARGAQGGVVKMVPFEMNGVWWYGEGDPGPCEPFGYPDDASVRPSFPVWEGTALHLGHYTATTTNCMRAQPDGSYLLLLHATEIVAANGDRLWVYGTQEDSEVVVYPDLSFEIIGPSFVGGTGRFENVQGSYHLYAESLMGGDFIILGEMSSVGSSK